MLLSNVLPPQREGKAWPGICVRAETLVDVAYWKLQFETGVRKL